MQRLGQPSWSPRFEKMARRLVTIECLGLSVKGLFSPQVCKARTITVFDILKVHRGCGRREVVDSGVFEAGRVSRFKSVTVNVSTRQ